MKLIKCPRCELNYIQETEKYCKVCLREMKGSHAEEEIEMCSVCNAAPALPGHDVCLSCLKEMNGTVSESSTDDNDPIVDGSALSMNSVSNMDEIIPEDDMDEEQFEGMEDELSLESVIDEEEEQENEDDDDN